MNYPKSVKDIENLNEFIRKAREIETDKYWSDILYDCSSANYADWTRRESRLKWKREMIQKYLDYKNRVEEFNKIVSIKSIYDIIDWNKYIVDKKFSQDIENYVKNDNYLKLAEFINNIKNKLNTDYSIDVDKETIDTIINQLIIFVKQGNLKNATIYTDKKSIIYVNIEDLIPDGRKLNSIEDYNKINRVKMILKTAPDKLAPLMVKHSGDKYLIKDGNHRYIAYKELGIDSVPVFLDESLHIMQEKASIDWNNYLTKDEVRKFLSKDDKVESAEEIIYNTTGNFYNKYFKYFKKSGWTKRKLTQDLANFYYKGHLNEDYVLRGLQNGKSYDLAYNKSRDKLEKFRDEVIGNKITTTWIDEHKIEESKHKIEEKSRNELLAKTKSQTITRYNKAQGYKGFYIYDIDTSTLFNKDSTMLIVCKVGDYHSQVEIQNVLYWIEYYAEQNENFQINTKNVTQALMDAIDGWNIKVNCECRRLDI